MLNFYDSDQLIRDLILIATTFGKRVQMKFNACVYDKNYIKIIYMGGEITEAKYCGKPIDVSAVYMGTNMAYDLLKLAIKAEDLLPKGA